MMQILFDVCGRFSRYHRLEAGGSRIAMCETFTVVSLDSETRAAGYLPIVLTLLNASVIARGKSNTTNY